MKNIAEALCRAMGHVDGAPKNSRNDQQRYDYTSTETMIAFCRGALRAEGLSIVPAGEEVEHRAESAEFKTSKGTPYTRDLWTFRFRWLLLHVSGESLTIERVMPVESGPGRPLDKAKAGGASMALSYALRDLLLIPRGEREVEVDARDDSGYMPGVSAAPAEAKPAEAKPAAKAGTGAAARLLSELKREGVPLDRLNAFLRAGSKPELPDPLTDADADAFGAAFFPGGLSAFRFWTKNNAEKPAQPQDAQPQAGQWSDDAPDPDDDPIPF